MDGSSLDITVQAAQLAPSCGASSSTLVSGRPIGLAVAVRSALQCDNGGNGGCSPAATCNNTSPGARTCACNAGFSGDGTTCLPSCQAGVAYSQRVGYECHQYDAVCADGVGR